MGEPPVESVVLDDSDWSIGGSIQRVRNLGHRIGGR